MGAREDFVAMVRKLKGIRAIEKRCAQISRVYGLLVYWKTVKMTCDKCEKQVSKHVSRHVSAMQTMILVLCSMGWSFVVC